MKENVELEPTTCVAVSAREGTIVSAEGEVPESPSERYMASLWQECIGVDRVLLSDKFLDVGGNSLTLNVILHRVETEKGVALDPVIFFESSRSSLRDIAGDLEKLSEASADERRVGKNH